MPSELEIFSHPIPDVKTLKLLQHPEFEYVFEKIQPQVVQHTKELIQKHNLQTAAKILGYDTSSYDNLLVAGRLLIFYYRRQFAETVSEYADDLEGQLQKKYYDYFKAHAEEMQKEIDQNIRSDYDFDYFSANTMIKTYSAKTSYDYENSCESPQLTYMRIAVQLFSDEFPISRVLQCYRELSNKALTPASPTLINACFLKNHLSSCFLARIQDNLESIMENVYNQAMISRANGALGIDFSLLRHSEIGGRNVEATPIDFIGIINASTSVVTQMSRKGATTVSLRSHHYDLIPFIKIVEKVGPRSCTFPDINTCIYVSDIFFERVKRHEKWTLFCPAKTPWLNDIYGVEFEKKYVETEFLAEQRQKEYISALAEYERAKEEAEKDIQNKTLRKVVRDARQVLIQARKNRINYQVVDAYNTYVLISEVQRRNGMPYFNAVDSINFKCNQNNLGYIACQNLCNEICLFSGLDKEGRENISSCNLSSLSLRHFVKSKLDRNLPIVEAIKNAFDFEHFGKITQNVVENIDQVITWTRYPLDKDGKVGIIHATNVRNRPIAIGSSGFAEMLYELDLRNEEDKDIVILLNKTVFASRYFSGMAKSVILAIEKGKYETFEGSELSKGNFQLDLWNKELKIKGFTKIRPEYETYIDPSNWSQKEIKLPNGDVILPTWDDLRRVVMKYGVRNSMLFAEMPTATCSQILRNTESSEQPQSNLYSRRILNGNYPVLNRYLVWDLEELGLWNRETLTYLQVKNGSIQGFDSYVNKFPEKFPNYNQNSQRLSFILQKFKTQWETSQKYQLQLIADRSKYVCHSVSTNLYFLYPTLNNLMAAHLFAYELGLKNIMYYLRQGSAINPIKFTIDAELSKVIGKIEGVEVETEKSPKREGKKIEVEKEDASESEEFVCDPNNKECLACQ